MKYFIYLSLLLVGCGSNKTAQPHLHNYPFLGDCPSVKEKSIDNEEQLKAEAKALNMRYVDYLHLLSNPPPTFPNKELWTNNE